MKALIEEENTKDDSAVGFLAISSVIRHQTLPHHAWRLFEDPIIRIGNCSNYLE